MMHSCLPGSICHYVWNTVTFRIHDPNFSSISDQRAFIDFQQTVLPNRNQNLSYMFHWDLVVFPITGTGHLSPMRMLYEASYLEFCIIGIQGEGCWFDQIPFQSMGDHVFPASKYAMSCTFDLPWLQGHETKHEHGTKDAKISDWSALFHV